MATDEKLPPLGRPLYIQTFLPTSEHIRKRSVLKVETLDDLNSKRLGVSAWEESCEYCDCFLEQCPGHCGSLELPVPIYRVFFVRRLVKILNSICFYCQRLRMPKSDSHYDWIRGLPKKQRLEYLVEMSKSYKTCCGDGKPDKAMSHYVFSDVPSLDIREPCQKPHVRFKNEDRDYTFVRAIIRLDAADQRAFQADQNWRPVAIGPQDIFDCLCSLDEETKFMLGCDELNDPASLMWDVLPVPSLNTRPSHTFAGLGAGKKRAFNDWTKYLRDIVSARNELRDLLKKSSERILCCHYIVNDVEHRNFQQCFQYAYANKKTRDKVKKRFKSEMKRTNYGALETAWRNLNKNTAAFHSSKHKKYIQKAAFGKPLSNLEDRYRYQKTGRFRGYCISRRTENGGRGVLEGEMDQEVDQVGIPRKEAMNLSLKVYVNALNMPLVQSWIINGPYEYPGANYVTMKNGSEINLAFYENRRDIVVSDVLFVRRHLIDDDTVIISRQPILHRPSMLTFRVKVIDGYCIRLHYAVFTPLGADCDGDEVNFQVLQGIEAIAEARLLSSVGQNIMKDGKIWIKFIQNPVIGAYLLTRPDVLIPYSRLMYIIEPLDVSELPEPAVGAGRVLAAQQWTGHQVVSMLLPRDFTLVSEHVTIRNGVMESGQLNDSLLNGTNGILSHLFRDYADKDVILKFLHKAYLVFQRYLDLFGHSVGYYDCAIDYHHTDEIADPECTTTASVQLREIMRRVNQVQVNADRLNAYSDTLVGHSPDGSDEATEKNLREHIDKLTVMSTRAVVDYHEWANRINGNDNGLLHMIRSGAKGSDSTLNQMCGVVGQIFVMYRRFPQTSSHFLKGRDTAKAFGFISQSYSRGVSLSASVVEAHATCESVVNKNKGTSKSGYTIRKLTSCMMGVVMNYRHQAINTHERIIWTHYGNDGYDPQGLTAVKLNTAPSETDSRSLAALRAYVCKLLDRCMDTQQVRVPFDFSHLFHRCDALNVPGCDDLAETDYERFTAHLWASLVRDRMVLSTNLTLKLLFMDRLSPRELAKRRYGLVHLRWLAEEIVALLARARIHPGESVGINATQNMGEPFAQLTLKTPHNSGKFTNVVAGTVRISNLIDSNYCNPQMTIVLKAHIKTEDQAVMFGRSLSRALLKDILSGYPVATLGDDRSECRIVFPIDANKARHRMISLRSVLRALSRVTDLPLDHFRASFMDQPEPWNIRVCIPVKSAFWTMIMGSLRVPGGSNLRVAIDNAIFNLSESIVVHGLPTIENFVTEHCTVGGEQRWVVTTLGSNLRAVLRMPDVDSRRTISNNVTEMCEVFGMHAARKCLEYEFLQVLSGMADARHIKLVARLMASDLVIKGMKIKQVAQNIPPLQRAAYEHGPEQMVEYCSVAEQDEGRTICGAVLMNKPLWSGTGFNLDMVPVENLVPDDTKAQDAMIPRRIVDYVFSPKADGVRHFLVLFHDRKGGRIAALVDRTNASFALPEDDLPEPLFAGTVLDGELTKVKGHEQDVFLVFDALMVCGNRCAVLRYDQRLEIAREVVHRMCPTGRAPQDMPLPMGATSPFCLPIRAHDYLSCFGVGAGKFPFRVAVKPVFDVAGLKDYERLVLPRLPFGFDGLVFTSLADPAYPFRSKQDTVLKWKPRHAEYNENTVDFVVTPANAPIVLRDLKPASVNGYEVSARVGPYEVSTRTGSYEVSARVGPYRKQTGNCCLWCTLPDKSMFLFSGGLDVSGSASGVCEARWNYRLGTWEVVKSRNKDANTLETTLLTVQNIIEEIGFAELAAEY